MWCDTTQSDENTIKLWIAPSIPGFNNAFTEHPAYNLIKMYDIYFLLSFPDKNNIPLSITHC